MVVRDMELIRSLLLYIEEHRDMSLIEVDEISEGIKRESEETHYHLKLIYQAGLINARVVRGEKAMNYSLGVQIDYDYIYSVEAQSLTWEGHEYLETIRDPEVWKNTKESAKKIGSFSFDVLKALGKGFIKKKIEQHTGVEVDI